MFRNGLVFRIIGALILFGLIATGGYMAYQAGVTQGVTQAPAVATAIAQAAQNGQTAPIPPMMVGHGYGYGYNPMYSHHFGFFPFSICGSILFIFIFFGFMKMIFFRGMMHRGSEGHHKHGPWGRHWEDGVPPMFNDWHKRAHGETAAPEENEEETKK